MFCVQNKTFLLLLFTNQPFMKGIVKQFAY